jgi:hypothetical protein
VVASEPDLLEGIDLALNGPIIRLPRSPRHALEVVAPLANRDRVASVEDLWPQILVVEALPELCEMHDVPEKMPTE